MRALSPLGPLPRWVLAASLLLVQVGALAQSNRVDTGLRLRMTDALVGDSAPGQRRDTRIPSSANAGAAAPASAGTGTSTRSPAADPGPRFRGLSLRLTSGLRFEDNVHSAVHDPQRDVILVTRPAVYLDARFGRHDLRLGYEADSQRYLGGGTLNRLNHNFLASGDIDLGRRLKSRIESALEFGTDQAGDIGTRPATGGEPDRWRAHRLGGEVTLGRRIAQAQIGLGYEISGYRYLNNAQQGRDHDRRDLRLTGSYHLGPKFSLVSRLSSARIAYSDASSLLDSREYSALMGLEWEATAKTSGAVFFGLRHRDFDVASQPSQGGYTWDARVTWAPKTYSQVTVYSSRQVSEGGFSTAGGGSVTITDTSGLSWRHGLSARTTFEASVERSLSGSGGEDDEYMSWGAGVRYRFNRWVDVIGDWRYRSRSSPPPGAGYDTGSVFLGLDVSLDHAFDDE